MTAANTLDGEDWGLTLAFEWSSEETSALNDTIVDLDERREGPSAPSAPAEPSRACSTLRSEPVGVAIWTLTEKVSMMERNKRASAVTAVSSISTVCRLHVRRRPSPRKPPLKTLLYTPTESTSALGTSTRDRT